MCTVTDTGTGLGGRSEEELFTPFQTARTPTVSSNASGASVTLPGLGVDTSATRDVSVDGSLAVAVRKCLQFVIYSKHDALYCACGLRGKCINMHVGNMSVGNYCPHSLQAWASHFRE